MPLKGSLIFPATQRLQYPSIKEYSLNHIKDPTIIQRYIFLNKGILESLGTPPPLQDFLGFEVARKKKV